MIKAPECNASNATSRLPVRPVRTLRPTTSTGPSTLAAKLARELPNVIIAASGKRAAAATDMAALADR